MRYLITGGTGTVGKALAQRLFQEGKRVTIFSRNEDAQIRMKHEFPSLTYFVGDVRDYHECQRATKDIDIIYHLAAMKHVARCEEQPQEAIKTNIQGTMNIVNAAIENRVKDLIYLSTDKVVNPTSLYGVTKLAGEKIVINANNTTRCSVIRSGNIFGSSNSIVPILHDQIIKNNSIRITSGEMTRFYITLPKLIDFLTSRTIRSGRIFIPAIDAFRLIDLAYAMFRKYGEGEFSYEETGLLPGEKVHECLFTHDEMPRITIDHGYWINRDSKLDPNIDLAISVDHIVNSNHYEPFI